MTREHDKPDPLDEARRTLPGEIPPRRDLWPAIRREIAGDAHEHVRGTTPSRGPSGTTPSPGLWERLSRLFPTPSWGLVGATAMVACLIGAWASWMLVGSGAERAERGGFTPRAEITRTLDALEHECTRVQADLLALMASPEYDASPETKDVLLANLAIIESAVAESRSALREHPNDAHLAALTLSAYRERLSFLKEATRIPVNAPERGQI